MTGQGLPDPAGASSWEVYRRLLTHARPYTWILIGAFIAMAAEAASLAGFTYLIQPLLDEGFWRRKQSFIDVVPFVLLGLIVFRAAAAFASQYGIVAAGRSVVRDLRQLIFEHYLRLPTAYFDANSSGKMISRLTYNVEQVARACTNALTILIRDSLFIIFLLAVLFYHSVALTLGILLLGPLIAWVIRLVSRRFRRLSSGIQDTVGDVAQITEEVVTGQHVVKVYGGQAQERDAFDRANKTNRRQHLKMIATQQASSGFVQICAGIALAGIVYFASGASMADDFSPGKFTSYMAAMLGLLPSLRRLTNVHSVIQGGVAAADSIFAVLDEPLENDTGGSQEARLKGHIRFDGVGLTYAGADAPALEGINLDIPPGSVTAFVGRSGSGKSSLVNLLPRFYEPTAGAVRIDDVPLQDLSLTALRDHIALVGQEVVLFDDSVANNIAYGALRGAAEKDIREAARKANALAFIEALPDGFDTRVGEGGALLSGGQRQRLAIARALLKDAPILILDEATSALDSESERAIQAALQTVMAGRTTLVIAHRLSTIEKADQVVVLENGRIVEQGTHSDLLAGGGPYAHLYQMQFQSSE